MGKVSGRAPTNASDATAFLDSDAGKALLEQRAVDDAELQVSANDLFAGEGDAAFRLRRLKRWVLYTRNNRKGRCDCGKAAAFGVQGGRRRWCAECARRQS